MSTTTLCRGLQSCLEPQLIQPLTLRLTLSHPPQPEVAPLLSDSNSDKKKPEEVQDSSSNNNNAETKKTTANGSFGGWSFIESLTKEANEEKDTPPYVHPLDKRASSKLSTKSLEMCTESLGSETGSDIGEESDLYSSSSSDSDSRRSPIRERSRFFQLSHKKTVRRSFPPPLTSISGSDYVQYTPHREGGRLVIKAVRIATTKTCFHAERGNGRLTLRYKSPYDTCSSSEEETDDDEEEKESQKQDHDTHVNEETNGSASSSSEEETDDEVKEDQKKEQDHDTHLNEETNGSASSSSEEETDDDEVKEDQKKEQNHDTCTNEETNGSTNCKVEGEMAIVKYQRPCSWYKENGHEEKRFLNWKPFLGVAI